MTQTRNRTKVETRPIVRSDIPALARFLHKHMHPGTKVDQWAQIIERGWSDVGGRGRLLSDGDDIVGVYLTTFSERLVAGHRRTVCNLGSWCVRPDYRFHSIRLVKEMVADQDIIYTDLTPIDKTVAVETRLGFVELEGATRLAPCLPWPKVSTDVTSDIDEIERRLVDPELRRVVADHRAAPSIDHVLLKSGERQCYVASRRIRRRGLFAHRILHVSNPAMFDDVARAYERHVLLKLRVVAYITDTHLLDYRPPLSVRLKAHKRLMRGDGVPSREIDYLYSELVFLPSAASSSPPVP